MEKKDTGLPGAKVTSYTEQDVSAEKSGFIVYHSFEAEELKTFLAFINDTLKEDPDVKSILPLADQEALISASKDGILLCKLINCAVAGTIDERTINRKMPINIYHKTENLRLAVNAAMAIGCHIVNINPQTILDGKLHLIMGMIWQIMRIFLLKTINLKTVPEIIVLAEPGETLEDILKLPSEKILVRWINYHLKNAKLTLKIKDLGSELKDCIAFIHLLSQLDPKCDTSSLADPNPSVRAEATVKLAEKLGMKSFIQAAGLILGNPKLNLVFCSLLFNTRHGLVISQEKKKEVENATLLYDAKERRKEERPLCLWINSLGLDGVFVNNLYTDTKDDLILLKVLNKIWPGVLDTIKYEKAPGTNRFKMMANGNCVVDICKKQKIIVAGVGGVDIVDSKQAQLLGLVWQLMRANYLQIIGGKTEDELIAWANKMVNKPPGIKNFRDPALKNSKFLINLLAAIEPEVIDWTLIKEGTKDEEIELNAKYCISIARKLGAKIFLTWEDIKIV